MHKVLLYSMLLIAGLVGSQFLPADAHAPSREVVKLLTTFCLAFIMIGVGHEFDIDKKHPRQYLRDYVVAMTAAAFPWLFCAVYFVATMWPGGSFTDADAWRDALLTARFSSPTSAGLLFAMLAAAGLSATWMFRKARLLAIFDDLDTVLLMIPLQMMVVGPRWQLGIVVAAMGILLWLAWRYLHQWNLPVTWKWMLAYSAILTAVTELIYLGSSALDPQVPIHFEVLLPAFVFGCVLSRGHPPEGDVESELEGEHAMKFGEHRAEELRAETIIASAFMVLVGLSMPALGAAGELPGWGTIALHVLAITLLSNLGKMVPAMVYRTEAHWKERLALAVGMFPRGEVGAGVLVVSLSYGLADLPITVALLSLALNLVMTGLFITVVRRLLEGAKRDKALLAEKTGAVPLHPVSDEQPTGFVPPRQTKPGHRDNTGLHP